MRGWCVLFPFVCPHPYPIPPPFLVFYAILTFCPPSRNIYGKNFLNWKIGWEFWKCIFCFSMLPFFVARLPFLIFPLRSLTELILFSDRSFATENMCAFFIIFFSYFYRFRVVLSLSRRFYRFSLVLSQLWNHCINFFLFLFNLEPFCERCGGKLSINLFYLNKIDTLAAM